MWVEAQELLRHNPNPTFTINDERISAADGPPVLFQVHAGETRMIVVEYKHFETKKAVVIIGVEAFPV